MRQRFCFVWRRIFLCKFLAAISCTVTLFFAAFSPSAFAQQFVRLVVPVPAGGSIDFLARILAKRLTDSIDTQVIVENRPGADGIIAAEAVSQRGVDGTTLLIGHGSLAYVAASNSQRFDPRSALRPVVKLVSSELFLVSTPSLKIAGPKSLFQIAKMRPKGLNCGAPPSVAIICESLGLHEKSIVTIPYQGEAPLITALISGQVELAIINRTALISLMTGDRVKPIASITSRPIMPPLTSLPSLREIDPDLYVVPFVGIFIARGTSEKIQLQLNQNFNQVLQSTEVIAQLQSLGYQVEGGEPSVLEKTLKNSIERYQVLMRKNRER